MVLKNKIVVITGSSSGIGKSTALEFAKKGAKIVVNYRSNFREAQKTVDEIKKLEATLFQWKQTYPTPPKSKRCLTLF